MAPYWRARMDADAQRTDARAGMLVTGAERRLWRRSEEIRSPVGWRPAGRREMSLSRRTVPPRGLEA
jgi:hypothetical protein